MKNSLQQIKLYIPKPKANFVPRPRLVDKINTSIKDSQRLIIITAPAGYGKSSLLAEWVHHAEWPVAWLSLDEQDNNPATFIDYLGSALKTINIQAGPNVHQTGRIQKELSVRKMFSALTNDIWKYDQKFVLVLDDFHMLKNPAIIEAFCILISDMPDNMHLIISGRSIPDIPCAKLKSRNEVLHLEENELRFTRPEIEKYFDINTAQDFSSEEFSIIEKRTEGWIAALQLILISLQSQPDNNDLIKAFPDARQDVTNYLLEEVLSTQPAELQKFLLDISPLHQFSPALLNDVLEDPHAKELLEEVIDRKMFIIPLDDRGEWYRYHHLIGEILRERNKHENPRHVLEIQSKAAAWFRRNEYWVEAIMHGIDSHDYQQAIFDIEKAMNNTWLFGGASRINEWITRLPVDLVRENPKIRLFLAWTEYMNGQVTSASLTIEELITKFQTSSIKKDLSAKEEENIFGMLYAMYSAVLCTLNHSEEAIKFSKKAQQYAEMSGNTPWHGISWNAQGVAYRSIGNMNEAVYAFQNAIQAHKKSTNLYGLLVAYSALAEIYYHQGSLSLVHQVCLQALTDLKDVDQRFLPLGMLYLSLGKVLLEWGEYEIAEEYLSKSIDSLIEDKDLNYLLNAYFQLAQLAILRAKPNHALQIMSLAKANVKKEIVPSLIDLRMRAYHARILSYANRGDPAALIFRSIDWNSFGRAQLALAVKELFSGRTSAYVVVSNPSAYTVNFEKITQALLFINQNLPDAALNILNSLVSSQENGISTIDALDIQILFSFAYQKLGDIETAKKYLRNALETSFQDNFISTYARYGSQIEPLLEMLLQEERERLRTGGNENNVIQAIGYLSVLIAAVRMRGQSAAEHTEAGGQDLVDALTDREMQVLKHLATGSSYQEIADSLVITDNTVRFHIKNIYGKLGVNNRVQAVTRANELNLVVL